MLVAGSVDADTGYDHDQWVDRNKNGMMDPYEDPSLPVDQRIDDLIGRMTLDEKTCQMGTIYGYKRILKKTHPTKEWQNRVWKDGVANIDEHANGVKGEKEMTGHVEHVELLNEIRRWFIEETRLGIPVDFTNEGIRSVCHSNASNFPSQLGIGATFDRDLVHRIGKITGKEGKSLGYSNLYPFEKVFTEAKPWGTMSSYNTYDGDAVTGSSEFLTDLLRKTYGFRGYVVSDSGAVERLHKQHGVAENFDEAIVQAVNAGMNVRTNFRDMEHIVLPLRKLVKEGRITEETINSHVADVLRVKFELGLFDEAFVDEDAVTSIVHTPENKAATLEAARKSMVLLKNDGILPLQASKIKTVFVTGPGADDVDPMISRYGPGESDVITPLAGIKALLGDEVEVLHARGADYKDARFPGSDILPEPPSKSEQAGLDEAVELAKYADVIIAIVGDDHSTVGESRSRTSLDLPGHQRLLVQEMVKTGKPVVVVLMAGRAVSINCIHQNVPAVLCCWHGGEKVGQAVAETLFGTNNPGGKHRSRSRKPSGRFHWPSLIAMGLGVRKTRLQTKTVTFTLNPKRDLKMLSRSNQWVVEGGEFIVRVGTSSSEKGIKQAGSFTLVEL